jgi:hypothetical protein
MVENLIANEESRTCKKWRVAFKRYESKENEVSIRTNHRLLRALARPACPKIIRDLSKPGAYNIIVDLNIIKYNFNVL